MASETEIPSIRSSTATGGDGGGGGGGGDQGKSWQSYAAAQAEDLRKTVFDSTASAVRSAHSIQETSFLGLHSLQVSLPQVRSQYKAYEDAFVNKVKEELLSAREHPEAAIGIGVAAGLLLLRGPRRFLFRQTIGRLQGEEARYLKTEKDLMELQQSINLMKKESKKLLERASFAQEEMNRGRTKLKNAGSEITRLLPSTYKTESEAVDIMDGLRELPGRDAIKLRAEVASLVANLKREREALDRQIIKISDCGISV